MPSPLGEDDVKIAVTATGDAQLDPAELHRWSAERMASFMVPRYIEVLDQLPRMPTGKLEKSALRDVGPATWDAVEATVPK